jgi:hypothetical protein
MLLDFPGFADNGQLDCKEEGIVPGLENVLVDKASQLAGSRTRELAGFITDLTVKTPL